MAGLYRTAVYLVSATLLEDMWWELCESLYSSDLLSLLDDTPRSAPAGIPPIFRKEVYAKPPCTKVAGEEMSIVY